MPYWLDVFSEDGELLESQGPIVKPETASMVARQLQADRAVEGETVKVWIREEPFDG